MQAAPIMPSATVQTMVRRPLLTAEPPAATIAMAGSQNTAKALHGFASMSSDLLVVASGSMEFAPILGQIQLRNPECSSAPILIAVESGTIRKRSLLITRHTTNHSARAASTHTDADPHFSCIDVSGVTGDNRLSTITVMASPRCRLIPLFLTILLLENSAWPWGNEGHMMINRVAAEKLPSDVPAFLRNAEDQLAYLGPEPDRWREKSELALKLSQEPDHFIDLELVEGMTLPPDRYSYYRALEAKRQQTPGQPDIAFARKSRTAALHHDGSLWAAGGGVPRVPSCGSRSRRARSSPSATQFSTPDGWDITSPMALTRCTPR